jgi:hypothetical protein
MGLSVCTQIHKHEGINFILIAKDINGDKPLHYLALPYYKLDILLTL